jgi:hypothetical protein
MAKKKRKHRNPVAPPIHSAPGTASAPSRPTTPAPGAARGSGPGSGPAAPAATAGAQPRARRQPAPSRHAAKQKRARRRNWLIIGSIVVLLIAALVVPRILGGRAVSELNTLGEGAGCSQLQETADSGAGEHLDDGERTTYSPLPPSHGPHSSSTLPGGVYTEELSNDPTDDETLYKAVHSLEHGAVILWHDGLSEGNVDDLTREYRDEQKVIVAPFKGLRGDNHFALTAWGRLMTCEKMSTRVADKFIDIFRNARTAPEPNNAI